MIESKTDKKNILRCRDEMKHMDHMDYRTIKVERQNITGTRLFLQETNLIKFKYIYDNLPGADTGGGCRTFAPPEIFRIASQALKKP